MRSGLETGFRGIAPEELDINPFERIGTDWMLVTAGGPGGWNTMTASWGGLGHLWNRNVCLVFVRPQRLTWEFMESSGLFTISFFDESRRAALEFCGSHSGRIVDKALETGLVPFEPHPGCVSFEQAELVLAARKIYSQDIKGGRFLDESVLELYPASDFHRMYVGEIVSALIRG